MRNLQKLTFALLSVLALQCATALKKVPGVGKAKERKDKPDNPWGNSVDWVDIDTAYRLGKQKNIPIMVIIWRVGCPACDKLKAMLHDNKEFIFFSRHFSMVNAEVTQNKWTKEEKFNVDGQYVPRIFFVDTNGEVLKEFDNELGNTKFSYFYPKDEQLVPMMKSVRDYFRRRKDSKETRDEL